MPRGPRKTDTRIVHAGRDPSVDAGGVNPPVQRASTVLIEKAEDLYRPGVWTYGLHGTATHRALKAALCELEEAEHCHVVASGLLACTIPIMALASPGSHILVSDNCYGPTRRFCDQTMSEWGCTTEYFSPDIGADIANLIRPETCVIFLESPGSLTFEISDTPAITAVARKAGIPTVMDNTWGAGHFHKPLDLGVDVSVQATSKYPGGSADLLGGSIVTRDEELSEKIRKLVINLGLAVSPDDAYLVLRGLRTMTTRMDRHQASGIAVAEWIARRPEVAQVLHPALPGDKYHDLWKRDFTGAAGLFAFALQAPANTTDVHAFLNALELFGLGFSWGGYESLAIPCDPQMRRTAGKPDFGGKLIRLSIGLESPEDLIADLEAGFAALAASIGARKA